MKKPVVPGAANARRFVRHIRANGAKHIQVWSCGDCLNESQREADIVEALTCTSDVTVMVRGKYETHENGLRFRVFLGRCLWVGANWQTREELADWRINEWSDRVFGSFDREETL